MSRPSPSFRRFVIAVVFFPAVAFTARGAQAPVGMQAPDAPVQVVVPFEHNMRQNAILVRTCTRSTARFTASAQVIRPGAVETRDGRW